MPIPRNEIAPPTDGLLDEVARSYVNGFRAAIHSYKRVKTDTGMMLDAFYSTIDPEKELSRDDRMTWLGVWAQAWQAKELALSDVLYDLDEALKTNLQHENTILNLVNRIHELEEICRSVTEPN